MRLLITSIAFFLFLGTTAAQYQAQAAVDSTHLMIGDQLRLHLEVSHPSGAQLLPLVLKKQEGDVIEFLAQTKWDTVEQGSTVRLRKDLLLTAWDSGYHDVPALPIVFLANAKKDTVFTRNIPLEIEAPAIDSVLADIKPIIEEPILWQDFIPEIAVVVLLLLAVLLWFLAKKFKKDKELPPPPPEMIPVHQIALEQLKKLAERKLWQQGQVKNFHSELTHIIRVYLENRYTIQALEQTTHEILGQMRELQIDGKVMERTRSVLQTADLVKFAKAEPPVTFHDQAMVYAEEFIHATKDSEVTIEKPIAVRSIVTVADPENTEVNAPLIVSETTEPEMANFGMRLAAWVLDYVFMSIMAVLIIYGIPAAVLLFMEPPDWFLQLVGVTLLVALWAYFAVMDHKKGGSLGKILIRIEVVDYDRKRISLGRASLRCLGKFITSAIFGIGDLLYFTDNKRRRTLSDRIAGTMVVRRRPKSTKNTELLDSDL